VVASDDVGAIIDSGVAGVDDSRVITSAFTACPQNGNLTFIGGFLLKTPVKNVDKSANIYAADASFTIDPALLGHALNLSGSLKPTVNLSENATRGDNHVHVISAAGISVGDVVIIYDNVIFSPSYPYVDASHPGLKSGESTIVSAINGNIITLADSLEGSYTTVNNAVLSPRKPITVNITGGEFIAPDSTQMYYHIRITNGVNCEIKGIRCESAAYVCLQLDTCQNSDIHDCYITNGNTAGTGYGISIANGCRNTFIHNNTVLHCRHAIACGGYGSSGIAESSNTRIYNNLLTGNNMSHIVDTHYSWTFHVYDNIIDAVIPTYTQNAVVTGAKFVTIERNTIRNCARVFATRSVITNQNVLIKQNNFYGDTGVENGYLSTYITNLESSSNGTFDSIVIEENNVWIGFLGNFKNTIVAELTIKNNVLHYDTPSIISSGRNGLYLTGIPAFTVEGNTIDGMSKSGIYILNSTGTVSNNYIFNPSRMGSSVGYGIEIRQTGTSTSAVTVHGNVIEELNTSYMTSGIAEFKDAAAYSNNIIGNNVVYHIDYSIAPTSVPIGNAATATATIINKGTEGMQRTLVWIVDGIEVHRENIALSVNEAVINSIDVIPSHAGNYTCCVDII
jgi:hypothetical protein